MLKEKTRITEQDYYQIVSSKYGADIAMLSQLRFAEIHRVVSDEIANGKSSKSQLIPFNKLIPLFLDRLLLIFKKDNSWSSIFVEDADVRHWISAWVLKRSLVSENE